MEDGSGKMLRECNLKVAGPDGVVGPVGPVTRRSEGNLYLCCCFFHVF